MLCTEHMGFGVPRSLKKKNQHPIGRWFCLSAGAEGLELYSVGIPLFFLVITSLYFPINSSFQ